MTATIDKPAKGSEKSPKTFDSFNPATDELVGTHPIHTEAEVVAAVDRARDASIWWQEIGFDGRKEYLQAWRSLLAKRVTELADIVHRECGKPHADALLEAGLAIDHIAWAAKHAKKVLGRSRVNPGLLMTN